jgi:drug/metabolite transporter (DMT)-like permease
VAGALAVAIVVGARVGGSDIGYGVAAGAANIAGLGLLYHGLAHGRIGVVAPLTAVVAAVVPVAWALARGERPAAIVLVGAVCAVTAGGLIAHAHDDSTNAPGQSRGVPYAIGAGALLGASLVLYAETNDASGFWPVLAARATGLVLVALAVAVFARRGRLMYPRNNARTFALAAGALDVTANVLLLAAVRHGLLVVVAPVAALAPAFTVLWAWVVLHEHLAPAQMFGLVLALIGLVLVAAG